MANTSVDRIFGALSAPRQMQVAQPIGSPTREVPQFAAKQRAVEGMSLPGKNPFGQISPVVANDVQGKKLPALYA